MTPITRPHWSFSSINQYRRCPLQFFFERIARIPRRTVSSSLVFGSAIHDALAGYHQRIKLGREATEQSLKSDFMGSWKVRNADQQVTFKAKESASDLVGKGQAMMELYSKEEPPANIIAVEERVLVPLCDSSGSILERPLAATCDLISGTPEQTKVTEFKTAAKAYSAFDVESSLQPNCYTQSALSTLDRWVSVEFVVFTKTNTPKIQRLKTSRLQEDLDRLGDVAKNIERAVENQIFYPIESPMNCSGCPFREECQDWRSTKPSLQREREKQQNREIVCAG
ncbi:PD-(D/E)XK nuclease superfamily protein [Neorhodopirellula lusitana]|uniref:PD-(D/E)XK nuclease superfamily protein n=1 Tax=Neorhodopirellula lusitana TaxID=445327 RepID=A0ABY1PRS9_9BACT|nr:PD-(D/E)XK nuclease family protein [Neorhodopirellula lusitana]SMP41791.1 PD-(D/E)XK nuclease superfamily protein [Neorhodopirellula lusitana]